MKSIIWNLTRACVWNCSFCCVAAKFVPRTNMNKELESSLFEDELDFESKIRVIDQLEKGQYRIDFSGGEMLMNRKNIDLVRYAADKLGNENIGISVSGAFIDDGTIELLKDKVHDVEITLDYIPFNFYSTRPVGYHEYAANAMVKLKKAGIRVGAQTVITKENISKTKILNLFHWLEDNHIDEWSLLIFFKSGRGMGEFAVPTHQEYVEIVDYIKEITKDSNVEVHFQYLLPNHDGYTLECRAVKHSIGILPDGTVVGCFWALDKNMKPTNDRFILGKVPEMSINDILNGVNSKYFLENEKKCAFFNKKVLENA